MAGNQQRAVSAGGRCLVGKMTINQNDLLDFADITGRIQTACRADGSQKAFADRCGVTKQFVGLVLNGVRQPSDTILAAVGVRKVIRYEDMGSAK